MHHLALSLYRRRLFALCLLFGQIACSSQPQHSLSRQEESLVFGRGGGVSGEVQSHILTNNGQLYATSSLFTDTVHLTDVEPETARRLFEQVDSLELSKLIFQHPGNRYYFIRYQQQKVVWGDHDNPPPLVIQRLYDSLRNTIPKQKQ